MSSILPTSSNSNAAAAVSTAVSNNTIAGNFTTFLQLLTTQLQNQNPLDPLDTNQFTQQLVEFAQVEQQLKSNDQLSTLVSLQQTAQASSALNLVGATVVVNGQTEQLANGSAAWTLNATTWNGQGNDGKTWPAGAYTLTATGVDASGQPSTITTQVQATVDSVDLTQNPPLLSISGQDYQMNQIQKIVRAGL
jgi:flagellar basal-body rod modification protein FlgD